MNLIRKIKLDNLSRPTQLLFFAVVLVLILVLMLLSKSWSEKQLVRQIKIEGNQFIDNNEISTLISPLAVNKYKKNVDLDTIKSILSQNPYILNVDLNIGITGNLNINIEERVPVAFLLLKNGVVSFADKSGIILPYKTVKQEMDLPVISGFNIHHEYDTTSILNGCKIIDFIKSQNTNDLYKSISELRFDSRYKSFDIFVENYPGFIRFGRADNLDEKYQKLNKILNSNSGFELLKIADYIDIRWNGQIVAGII